PTGPSGADAAPESPEWNATPHGVRWHPAGTSHAVLKPQVSGVPTHAVQGSLGAPLLREGVATGHRAWAWGLPCLLHLEALVFPRRPSVAEHCWADAGLGSVSRARGRGRDPRESCARSDRGS